MANNELETTKVLLAFNQSHYKNCVTLDIVTVSRHCRYEDQCRLMQFRCTSVLDLMSVTRGPYTSFCLFQTPVIS